MPFSLRYVLVSVVAIFAALFLVGMAIQPEYSKGQRVLFDDVTSRELVRFTIDREQPVSLTVASSAFFVLKALDTEEVLSGTKAEPQLGWKGEYYVATQLVKAKEWSVELADTSLTVELQSQQIVYASRVLKTSPALALGALIMIAVFCVWGLAISYFRKESARKKIINTYSS